MKKPTLLILICACLSGFSYGQTIQNDVTAAGGAQFSAGNFDMEFTLGEVVTETLVNSDLIVTQGFLQTNLTPTSIEDNSLTIKPAVFPNPTSESLIIELPVNVDKKFNYQFYNSLGKLLMTDVLVSGKNTLSMKTFPSGTYLLTIKNTKSGKQNIYKIIKSE